MDVNAVDEHGMTLLMWSAMVGNVQKVHDLLAKGAQPNARPNGSPVALCFAMETHCTIQMVEILLAVGADVNASAPGEHTILMRAVTNTDLEIIRCLLEAGAEVNAVCDENGQAALMIAVLRTEGAQIVPLLLAKGADTHIKDKKGRTALTQAIERENWQVVALLQEETMLI